MNVGNAPGLGNEMRNDRNDAGRGPAMTGHLFGERYQIGDTLGFGGMSEVHRGRDLRLGRDVAVKVLRADLARDPSFQTRFRREAQNAASLNHPAIVAVYDTGETPGETGPIPYIVMEYVDGETLRDVLKREGPLQPRRAMEITADICAALDFSHRHGIVHRDIKPANVMLTRAGAVKVMDFGIARAVADGQSSVTATAAVIGTAQYLSPEQARGEAVDARSDVYATGCVLFELLTGQPPFTGDSPVAIAYQHVREEPKAPSDLRPGLPRDLDSIVLKALNKNPLNRYQTAAEMRSDLVRALSGQAVLATPKMSDEERTQIMRATPSRVGAGGPTPPLLAPPRRVMPADMWAEDEPPRRNRGRIAGFITVGVILVALLAGAIYLTVRVTTTNKPAATVAVADVQNMSQADATAALLKQQLKVGNVTSVASSDAQKGKVVKQNPSANTRADVGSAVDLQIGAGVSAVVVPNLNGLTGQQATAQLQALNLKVDETTKASNDVDKGKVISQNPTTNTSVKPGTTVSIVVGAGQSYTSIPTGLKGLSYNDALAKLKAAHLEATKAYVDSVDPKDQVEGVTGGYQEGQASVAYGTPIPLTVSNNSQMKMPTITGGTPDQALAQLKAAGWTGTKTSDIAKNAPQDVTVVREIGTILQQDPAPAKVVSKSQRITITLAQAKMFTVPSLVGLSISDAQAKCDQAQVDCQLTSVGEAPASQPQLGNTVTGQSPSGGSQVRFDNTFVQVQYLTPYVPPPPPTHTSTSTSTKTSTGGAPGGGGGGTSTTPTTKRGTGGG